MSTPISPNGPERPDAPWDNLDDPYWNPPAPRPPTLRSPSPEPLEPMSMPNSPAPVSPTVSGLRVDDYDFDPATLGPSVPPSPGQTSDLSEPYVWEGFDADPELPPATPGRITDEYINSTLGLDQFHANQTPGGTSLGPGSWPEGGGQSSGFGPIRSSAGGNARFDPYPRAFGGPSPSGGAGAGGRESYFAGLGGEQSVTPRSDGNVSGLGGAGLSNAGAGVSGDVGGHGVGVAQIPQPPVSVVSHNQGPAISNDGFNPKNYTLAQREQIIRDYHQQYPNLSKKDLTTKISAEKFRTNRGSVQRALHRGAPVVSNDPLDPTNYTHAQREQIIRDYHQQYPNLTQTDLATKISAEKFHTSNASVRRALHRGVPVVSNDGLDPKNYTHAQREQIIRDYHQKYPNLSQKDLATKISAEKFRTNQASVNTALHRGDPVVSNDGLDPKNYTHAQREQIIRDYHQQYPDLTQRDLATKISAEKFRTNQASVNTALNRGDPGVPEGFGGGTSGALLVNNHGEIHAAADRIDTIAARQQEIGQQMQSIVAQNRQTSSGATSTAFEQTATPAIADGLRVQQTAQHMSHVLRQATDEQTTVQNQIAQQLSEHTL